VHLTAAGLAVVGLMLLCACSGRHPLLRQPDAWGARREIGLKMAA
jgi:hypothetical protein